MGSNSPHFRAFGPVLQASTCGGKYVTRSGGRHLTMERIAMKNEDTPSEVEEGREQPVAESTEASTDDAEFKVTVRKLEVPVRPRGVLAE